METAQQYRELIEKIILNNRRFVGNEDLLEDFCSETFKRSYLIISSIKNVDFLESYLNKVANTAILGVLKSSGRLQRTSSGYKKVNISDMEMLIDNNYPEDDIIYDIPDPSPNFEDAFIEKETVIQIEEILDQIDAEFPDMQFLNLFNLRYLNNYKQSEIAAELNISQGEVSKRLVDLTSMINERFS